MECSKLRHIFGQGEALINHLVKIEAVTPEAGSPDRRTHMVQDGRSRRTSSKGLGSTAGGASREGNLLRSSGSSEGEKITRNRGFELRFPKTKTFSPFAFKKTFSKTYPLKITTMQ